MKLPIPILLALGLTAAFSDADDTPAFDEVATSMKKAVMFLRSNLSVNGGYASEWAKDLSEGRVEGRSSPTVISIQPPGTTTLGLALVSAYEATGDPLFLQGAREAAQALLWCQLSSGGWESDYDIDPAFSAKRHFRRDVIAGDIDPAKRRCSTTLDDNKTQSAMLFLLEFAHTDQGREDKVLLSSLEFAWTALFEAQYPNGAWPQQFNDRSPTDLPVKRAGYPETWPREYPKERYVGFYTLNDGNLERLMELLLRAYELTGEARFIDSAKRLGDFLLLAQFEGDQPAWAQQYNYNMEPVWARKFEPPAIASVESFSAIRTLYRLWIATGEKKYVETIPAALDWLERSELPDGKWARFYELKTNRALYCVADTYELTYDDSNFPTHYGFKIENLRPKIDRMREELNRPHEEAVRRLEGPSSKEGWAKRARDLRGKVRNAMKSQHENGCWYDGETIDAREIGMNLQVMSGYLEAIENSQ